MAALSPKLLEWLHRVLQNQYQDTNRTFTDATQLLSNYRTFLPRTDVYTFESGQSALLLHLAGTIPAIFRGTIYSFPISVWIPQAYPREGPIGFVTPTRDIVVRPGQHVSGEGRIYHPYLSNWHYDKSNLVGFLQALQDVFSREPPVISKQTQSSVRPLRSQLNDGVPSTAPLHLELERPPFVDRSLKQQQRQPPIPPPKPFQSRGHYETSSANGIPIVPPHPSLAEYQPRVIETLPSNVYVYNPLESQSAGQHSLQGDVSSSPRRNEGTPPSRNLDHRHGSRSPIISSNTFLATPNQTHSNQGRFRNAPPPPVRDGARRLDSTPSQVNPTRHPDYPPSISHSQNYNPSHLSQQPIQPHLVIDLLSTPFDAPLPSQRTSTNMPAPPIPPNPEKDALLSAISRSLTQNIHALVQSHTSALTLLQAQHVALQKTLQDLATESHQLKSLSNLLSSNEGILHAAMRDADTCIADAKHRSVPGVDEVLVAPTVVGEQLYELVAEEMSSIETRAVLGKALDRGRIASEGWVKGVRQLARDEFLTKVVAKKCAQGMGLRKDQDDKWV